MNTPTPRTDAAAWPETDLVEGYIARELELELTAVTEQRDRLAEALRKIKNAGGTHSDPYDELDFIADVIFEALQSLNEPTEP